MISRARQFLFIHVQKTGGSAVTHGLNAVLPDLEAVPGTKHLKLGAGIERFPELADYFTMGFVRNPWERLYSWHAMILRRAAASSAGTYDAELFARNEFWQRVVRDHPDFEGFVMEGTARIRRLRVPQIDYLATGSRRADFIGRTESLNEDLERGLRLAGIGAPSSLERTNAAPTSDFRIHYTPAMRDRVADLAARDTAEFGYSFSA